MLCFCLVFLAFVEFAFIRSVMVMISMIIDYNDANISFIGIFVKRMKINDLVRITTLRQMTR